MNYRSSIAKAVWPAIPAATAAKLIALQYQFERSERQPLDFIRHAQYRQLTSVLEHAAATVPYYRKKFAEAQVDIDRLDDPDSWGRIPFLTRRDIQNGGETLHSSAYPPDHGRLHETFTSGSTGAPVRIQGTQLTQLFLVAVTIRNCLWHGFDFAQKLAVIRSYPGRAGARGGQSPRWASGIDSVFVTGPSAFISVNNDVARQFEWLEREQPVYLVTYPSNLNALLLHSQRQNKRLPSLRAVQTLSEILFPETRELCRRVWGVEIIDMYATQEVGYIALQCPNDAHYHVQTENLFVEVLDHQGAPCQPGETGRIVVTTLHNFAMPLIRYDIGDHAVVGEACSCGRTLPVLSRILGRVRNMMTLPDGRKLWPQLGAAKLGTLAPIRQWQLIQKSTSSLELVVVSDRPLTAEEEENIRLHVNGNVGATFSISFDYCNSIARGAGGKFEDFRSEVV